jgi:hypothetical protein
MTDPKRGAIERGRGLVEVNDERDAGMATDLGAEERDREGVDEHEERRHVCPWERGHGRRVARANEHEEAKHAGDCPRADRHPRGLPHERASGREARSEWSSAHEDESWPADARSDQPGTLSRDAGSNRLASMIDRTTLSRSSNAHGLTRHVSQPAASAFA